MKSESQHLPSSRISVVGFRILIIAAISVNMIGASITWDGGGDGVSWNDPNNWSGDALPSSVDDVAINSAGNRTVLIESRNVRIRSVTCETSLSLSGANLTVTAGASLVNGAFRTTGERSLTVSGRGTSFLATGATSIDGASLYAIGGAELSLPAVAS